MCRLAAAIQCAVLGSVVLLTSANAQTTRSPLWHGLAPGSYAVGFRLISIVDSTETPRRIVRVGLWYPAREHAQRVMQFGEYATAKPDTVPDPSIEAWQSKRDRESLGRQFFGPSAQQHLDVLFAAPTGASSGVPPAVGKFPLVIHSLGRNGGLYQHTVLWEYLASHGFVVATVAEFGRDTAKPGMDFALDDLKLHQSDMRRALGSLSQLGFVDSTRVGAIGHSSGGIVALWLAAERPNIRAVIGLDASVNRDEGGKDMFFKGLGGRTASAAFLNICRWPHDEYVEYASRVLRGDYHRIGYTRAVHVDFQNWPAYLAFAGAREPSTEKTRSVAQAGK